MTDLAFVPVTTADEGFLAAMLCEAAFWRDPDRVPPPDEVLQQPDLARYVDGWGRAGDRGLIANVAGEKAGAAWLRRYTADDRGYGFVDDATPELSIAVGRRYRGLGIGRGLLAGVLVQAELDAVAQVSLSVETDNPACRLYERFGFRVFEQVDGAVTMIATLGQESRSTDLDPPALEN